LASSLGVCHPVWAAFGDLSSCGAVNGTATACDRHGGFQDSVVYPNVQGPLRNTLDNLKIEASPQNDSVTFKWLASDLTHVAYDATDKHWRLDEGRNPIEDTHHSLLDLSRPSFDQGTPQNGSWVAASPAQGSIQFAQQLEPAFSSFQVANPLGAFLGRGDVHVDPKDRAQLILSLPRQLAPLGYRVIWRPVPVAIRTSNSRFTFVAPP